MRFLSTRNILKKELYTFEDVLFMGYAPDGGLFMPEYMPKINSDTLKIWRDYSYAEMAFEILNLFISEGEISRDTLKDLLNLAFSYFDIPEIIRLNYLMDGTNILELYHGPTMAFKDLSMLCIGQFMNYFLKQKQKRVIILVGTSGDTGGAAVQAFKGLEQIDLIVLYPKGVCTKIQELHMTVTDKNIHIIEVEGNSDELDVPIQSCFEDEILTHNDKFSLCCINSINMVRVLVQIVHHVFAFVRMSAMDWNMCTNKPCVSAIESDMYSSTYGYLNKIGSCPSSCDESVKDLSDKTEDHHCVIKRTGSLDDNFIELVIPSGAGGNAAGACLAIQMGIPIKLTLAVNVNDIIKRTLNRGDFSALTPVKPTLSVSMDILCPYNMERIFYIYSKGDAELTTKIMRDFSQYKNVTIPPDLLNEMQKDLKGYECNDETVKSTIVRCYMENNFILCPHTAVGVAYFYECLDGKSLKYPMVCEATASHHKFPSSTDTIKQYLKDEFAEKIVVQSDTLPEKGPPKNFVLSEEKKIAFKQKMDERMYEIELKPLRIQKLLDDASLSGQGESRQNLHKMLRSNQPDWCQQLKLLILEIAEKF